MEEEKDSPAFVDHALTRRELTLLAHLANDRSSQEIALLETLAHSSVKWYIHQIYVKLGVNKRSQAITRARQLGLLQPEAERVVNTAAVKNNLPIELTHFFGREAEILQIKQRLTEWRLDALLALEGCAWALNLNAKPIEAVRLLGAAADFRARIGAPVFLRDQPLYQQITAALKERLGEQGFAAAWSEGQSLGFEQACQDTISP